MPCHLPVVRTRRRPRWRLRPGQYTDRLQIEAIVHDPCRPGAVGGVADLLSIEAVGVGPGFATSVPGLAARWFAQNDKRAAMALGSGRIAPRSGQAGTRSSEVSRLRLTTGLCNLPLAPRPISRHTFVVLCEPFGNGSAAGRRDEPPNLVVQPGPGWSSDGSATCEQPSPSRRCEVSCSRSPLPRSDGLLARARRQSAADPCPARARHLGDRGRFIPDGPRRRRFRGPHRMRVLSVRVHRHPQRARTWQGRGGDVAARAVRPVVGPGLERPRASRTVRSDPKSKAISTSSPDRTGSLSRSLAGMTRRPSIPTEAAPTICSDAA